MSWCWKNIDQKHSHTHARMQEWTHSIFFKKSLKMIQKSLIKVFLFCGAIEDFVESIRFDYVLWKNPKSKIKMPLSEQERISTLSLIIWMCFFLFTQISIWNNCLFCYRSENYSFEIYLAICWLLFCVLFIRYSIHFTSKN